MTTQELTRLIRLFITTQPDIELDPATELDIRGMFDGTVIKLQLLNGQKYEIKIRELS